MSYFRIEEMHHHRDGFLVATVTSYFDQSEITLHNRFGAWYIGDPDDRLAIMRAPETVSPDLPFFLQTYKNTKGKVTPKPVNPFITKAAKKNPMIAKLLAQGKIG
jgi:hypothetical protein